ncbi:GAF and ANTAR domain-containing protein [Saccharopolyspora sp. K220]|nr:GAF and ANTAR domain-containing protein [Saccharopolyspora soli]
MDGAAITMMTDAYRQEPLCATDELASELDQLQFSLGEGPCVEALTSGSPVLVSDMADSTTDRWPIFATKVRHTRARALYVFPLQLGTIKVGVLNLHRVVQGPLLPEQLTGALRAADAALWILLGHRAGGTLDNDGSSQWTSGYPLHRAEVHQATGMIMAQANVSAEAAVAMLRASAFANDRPIDEVAQDVVARRLRFEEGPR